MIRLNRELLQQLSEQHLADAQVLLEQKRWPGAYYLAGYSVECALKACIAKLTKVHDFPDTDFGRSVIIKKGCFHGSNCIGRSGRVRRKKAGRGAGCQAVG
ncbi:MAG: HEPN domain-containing protein [Bryobacteraceae bacterium]|jgi:hypothetical protein